jgi:hypothetical protein
MKLLLIRDAFSATTTLGKLYVNGAYRCETLEDADRHLEDEGAEKVHGETAIPIGIYNVVIDYSNRFQRPMPHILDVSEFEGVRIHPGNTAADTEGCVLVGSGRLGESVVRSRIAFEPLFDALEAAYDDNESITLEIRRA